MVKSDQNHRERMHYARNTARQMLISNKYNCKETVMRILFEKRQHLLVRECRMAKRIMVLDLYKNLYEFHLGQLRQTVFG